MAYLQPGVACYFSTSAPDRAALNTVLCSARLGSLTLPIDKCKQEAELTICQCFVGAGMTDWLAVGAQGNTLSWPGDWLYSDSSRTGSKHKCEFHVGG